MKRTALLTEYKNLDPVARKGVRNSAVEAIKLIVVLGFRIEAPIVDLCDNYLARSGTSKGFSSFNLFLM